MRTAYSPSARTGVDLPDPTFLRVPNLLGPIFEEAGTGDRQVRESLFLTFNVDLGFFESRLLGPVRATGAAVTVIADSGVFAPDPRNVRSAGHGYALGLAAMSGAFHPKLTILAGQQRALVGIGSGNLTIGGWHANDEVLTSIHASRDEGAPLILRDLVRFLRDLPGRVTISQLAVDGIGRTADQLAALLDAAEPIETGHRLLDSVRGPILQQLPFEAVDELELTAPFHDLAGKAFGALVARYQPQGITVLAQPGQAVMDPKALQREADAANCRLRFVQLAGEEVAPSRYRHGKVLTALRDGAPVWSVAGSANLSAAALLGTAPSGNCELAVLHDVGRSLLPTPTVAVADVPALFNKIAGDGEDADPLGSTGSFRLLEARAVEQGIEVTLSGPASEDMLVEVSPYAASPDDFRELGVISTGSSTAVFPGYFGAGSRVRVAGQLQFLAFADQVVKRMQPVGAGRPNHNSTVSDIFSSDVAAAQWHDALTRLLLTHGQSSKAPSLPIDSQDSSSTPSVWRTLDDADTWADYAENALVRLGMPIFQLAVGSVSAPKPVGSSLPNTAPAWEDRFEETTEAFEEGETVETAEHVSDASGLETPIILSSHQRTRLRRWVNDIVTLMPQLGPLEQVAICQLTIAGSSALIWDASSGSRSWFDPLASALEAMNQDHWPAAAAAQAAAVSTVGLYRLRMAVPPDERGTVAVRFFELARSLQPLTKAATRGSIAHNLELLAGTTFVAPSADDVVMELEGSASTNPRAALVRVLERVLADFDLEWVDDHKLLLTGSATNPRAIAAEVLKHASGIADLAVGVNANPGVWAVVGRIPGRLTLIEGGKRPTTFKTYNTSNVLNPMSVLTDQELGQTNRISSPPFTKPGDVDLEVLHALNLGEGQMCS